MQINLPKGISGIKDTPRRKESLVNLYFADGYLHRTPGIDSHLVVDGRCRGAAKWYADSNAYFVCGDTLYQVDGSASVIDLGVISGSADVKFSSGQVNLVIVVKGGAAYTYNATSGLQPINDSDYQPSNDVDFIDGRHVFIPSDGSPAFYSEIDQPNNILPLSFFDAEELPDKNGAVINVTNNLHIGGAESFEQYRTTGTVTAPFARREGGRVDVGFVAGAERYLSSFVFLGRNRDQSYAIHLMQQGATQIISNERINEILNGYNDSQLEGVTSYSYQWNGHQFVGWNLPNETIEFVDGNWIYRSSGVDVEEPDIWSGRGVCFAHGRYYVGDRSLGRIGELSDVAGEYGGQVEYELQTIIRSNRERYFSISELVIDSLTGINNTTIGLSLSRDGRSFSDFKYKNLGLTGVYNIPIKWSGGLGRYESYCGIKLRGTGNVQISIEGVQIK